MSAAPLSNVKPSGTSKSGPKSHEIFRERKLRDYQPPEAYRAKERLNLLKQGVTGGVNTDGTPFGWGATAFERSQFLAEETPNDISGQVQRAGFAPLLAEEYVRQHQHDSDEAFADDFRFWLRGKDLVDVEGDDNNKIDHELAKTLPWNGPFDGPQLMHLPGVADYFDQFVDRRAEFEKKLTSLILRGPHDLTSAFYYYKYVVRGLNANPDEQIKFLQSYDRPDYSGFEPVSDDPEEHQDQPDTSQTEPPGPSEPSSSTDQEEEESAPRRSERLAELRREKERQRLLSSARQFEKRAESAEKISNELRAVINRLSQSRDVASNASISELRGMLQEMRNTPRGGPSQPGPDYSGRFDAMESGLKVLGGKFDKYLRDKERLRSEKGKQKVADYTGQLRDIHSELRRLKAGQTTIIHHPSPARPTSSSSEPLSDDQPEAPPSEPSRPPEGQEPPSGEGGAAVSVDYESRFRGIEGQLEKILRGVNTRAPTREPKDYEDSIQAILKGQQGLASQNAAIQAAIKAARSPEIDPGVLADLLDRAHGRVKGEIQAAVGGILKSLPSGKEISEQVLQGLPPQVTTDAIRDAVMAEVSKGSAELAGRLLKPFHGLPKQMEKVEADYRGLQGALAGLSEQIKTMAPSTSVAGPSGDQILGPIQSQLGNFMKSLEDRHAASIEKAQQAIAASRSGINSATRKALAELQESILSQIKAPDLGGLESAIAQVGSQSAAIGSALAQYERETQRKIAQYQSDLIQAREDAIKTAQAAAAKERQLRKVVTPEQLQSMLRDAEATRQTLREQRKASREKIALDRALAEKAQGEELTRGLQEQLRQATAAHAGLKSQIASNSGEITRLNQQLAARSAREEERARSEADFLGRLQSEVGKLREENTDLTALIQSFQPPPTTGSVNLTLPPSIPASLPSPAPVELVLPGVPDVIYDAQPASTSLADDDASPLPGQFTFNPPTDVGDLSFSGVTPYSSFQQKLDDDYSAIFEPISLKSFNSLMARMSNDPEMRSHHPHIQSWHEMFKGKVGIPRAFLDMPAADRVQRLRDLQYQIFPHTGAEARRSESLSQGNMNEEILSVDTIGQLWGGAKNAGPEEVQEFKNRLTAFAAQTGLVLKVPGMGKEIDFKTVAEATMEAEAARTRAALAQVYRELGASDAKIRQDLLILNTDLIDVMQGPGELRQRLSDFFAGDSGDILNEYAPKSPPMRAARSSMRGLMMAHRKLVSVRY